jgi:2-dehydro-3-deoxygluconokinase
VSQPERKTGKPDSSAAGTGGGPGRSLEAIFFGEVLLRLDTRGHERFLQARELRVSYTGAEANVAVALDGSGIRTHLVSAVPPGEIGDACLNAFRAHGVDTGEVLRTGSRLGLFYLETGAAQRASKVIYDRAHSAFAELEPGRVPWDEILPGKDWFHLSGTSMALTRNAAEASIEACERARAHGLRVSLDLNFRSSLWRWDPAKPPADLAGEVLRRVLPQVDVIITNVGQAADVLGIRADSSAAELPAPELCARTARRIAAEFEAASLVAMTMREIVAAGHNRWGAMLHDARGGRDYFAPLEQGRYQPHEITAIVDRVGAGDSFAAELIRGMLLAVELQRTLELAVAASCLKHSIPGDFNLVSRAEIEALADGRSSGHIQR